MLSSVRAGSSNDVLPLLIIGGGIHGTIISLALARYFPPSYHRLVDPYPYPLWRWTQNCNACGLRYLRSPMMHHLSADTHSLARFSSYCDGQPDGQRDAHAADSPPLFIPRYKRPLFSLFMQHAAHLITTHNLAQFRMQGRCRYIQISASHVKAYIAPHAAPNTEPRGESLAKPFAKTESGEQVIKAARVILATGMTEQLNYPDWARPFLAAAPPHSSTDPPHHTTAPPSHAAAPPHAAEAPSQPAAAPPHPIAHVFSDSFSLPSPSAAERICIIGGGITALQLALTLSAAQSTRVLQNSSAARNKNASQSTRSPRPPITVLSRHALRYADFDSDPCYLGPRCLQPFDRLQDMTERASAIRRARNRASIPPDIAEQFRKVCAEKRCAHAIGEVRRAALDSSGRYILTLADGTNERYDRVLLATGFRAHPQENALIHDLTTRYQLPCDEEGVPITDAQLQWHPRVLLSGGYGALTAGPAAGNIIGAHLSLRRILPLFLGAPYKREYAWRPLSAVWANPHAADAQTPPHR